MAYKLRFQNLPDDDDDELVSNFKSIEGDTDDSDNDDSADNDIVSEAASYNAFHLTVAALHLDRSLFNRHTLL